MNCQSIFLSLSLDKYSLPRRVYQGIRWECYMVWPHSASHLPASALLNPALKCHACLYMKLETLYFQTVRFSVRQSIVQRTLPLELYSTPHLLLHVTCEFSLSGVVLVWRICAYTVTCSMGVAQVLMY